MSTDVRLQDEKEKKAQEVLLKKQERDKLLEEEMNSIKGAKSSVLPAKVTRAHIDVALEREKAVKIGSLLSFCKCPNYLPTEYNVV